MPAGIRLHTTDSGDVPTPEADQVTIFVDSGTGEPSYKDEADAVHSLVGTAGAPGADANPVVGIVLIVDGSTGIKGDILIPFDCTINQWSLLADQSGSIVIDVWKDTYANFPPTGADSITASAKPTISSATKGQSSTLTGWTTTITAGDVLRFNVDSVTTITRCTIVLKVTKT